MITIPHLFCNSTLPIAAVEVAISRTNESPFAAGAPKDMGLVPNVHAFALVPITKGEVFVMDIP